MTLDRRLVAIIRAQFRLEWRGIHGVPHWARVRAWGLELAALTGARARVVETFAFLHDARRLAHGFDDGHGLRAARYAEQLGREQLGLDETEMRLLLRACETHSDGLLEDDVTVMTCWDADRLDLGRVGIRPDPQRLCTAAAREPERIERAYQRSVAFRHEPPTQAGLT